MSYFPPFIRKEPSLWEKVKRHLFNNYETGFSKNLKRAYDRIEQRTNRFVCVALDNPEHGKRIMRMLKNKATYEVFLMKFTQEDPDFSPEAMKERRLKWINYMIQCEEQPY